MNKFISILSIIIIFLFSVSNIFSISVELISTSPAPVIAGDYADITLRFTNDLNTNPNSIDNTKTNIIFKVEKTDFILPISKNKEIISKFFNGETITRTFRIYFSNDLKQGYINLPINIIENELSYNIDIPIFIEDSKTKVNLMIGALKTIPNELIADSDNNKFEITIQNLGEKKAELIKAKLIPLTNSIKASHTFSLEDSIANLDNGEEAILEFNIDVDINASKLMPVILKLRYRSEDSIGGTYELHEKEINFTIPLVDSPFLIIEKVELLDEFKAGTVENRLKITIKNNGLEDAKDVRVRIIPDISYPFIFEETTQYITAKIKSMESSDIIFKTEIIKNSEARIYDTNIIMESLSGEVRYSREDIVSIETKSGDKKNMREIGIILIITILIVSSILGIFTFISKRKK